MQTCSGASAREVLCHTTPHKGHGQMHSGKLHLHSNTKLLTIFHSLTVENTIISLTETIFTGEHASSFPS
jgi:hypothetical protein